MITRMPANLTVFYDGLCPLCSREIEHYRRRVTAGAVEFVDIAKPEFDALALGLNPVQVHRHIHARVGGQFVTGVDAFREIWGVIPGFRWLRWVTGLPVIYPASKVLYAIFARLRPLLPKRKWNCSGGQCRV